VGRVDGKVVVRPLERRRCERERHPVRLLWFAIGDRHAPGRVDQPAGHGARLRPPASGGDLNGLSDRFAVRGSTAAPRRDSHRYSHQKKPVLPAETHPAQIREPIGFCLPIVEHIGAPAMLP